LAPTVVAQDQILDAGLANFQGRPFGEDRLDGLLVERAVGLGAGALDGRTLAAVQEAELDAGAVGRAAHDAVQRIDLAHQMALAQPADRRVAGHRPDAVALVGD
jgi:hypothetical protein